MADVWANSMACHPRDTCHIAGCKNATMLKIIFRHIYYFCFLNAVWALTSSAFGIVSDTFVLSVQRCPIPVGVSILID